MRCCRVLLAALFALLAAAGCGNLPRPFQPDDKPVAHPLLSRADHAGVIVMPLSGIEAALHEGDLVFRRGNGRWSGRADDVVGEAVGQSAGNALNWSYTLHLPVDDKVYEVQFDDWMFLMDERVMLNKAVMSKFGIRLGEVTLSFYKR